MGDPVAGDRMVSRRGVPAKPKPKPNVLVKLVPPSKWLLVFDTWTFEHEIARYLFQSGDLPAGFTLEPTRKGDFVPNMRWTLTWQGRLKDHLSKFTPLGVELHERTQLLTVQQGDEFPEDVRQRERDHEIANEMRREHNKTFLPSLNMTAEKAMRTLKPGAYVAAPRRTIIPLSPVQPYETFPPPVAWMRDYKDGYFVWISDVTGQMQMVPISNFEQFWKDITWDLKQGVPLHQAVKDFDKRWDELYFMMIAGFALALTNAPGSMGRADIGDTAFATATRDANRMIGRQVRKPKNFGKVASKIDPIEAANVGITGTAVVMQAAQIKEDIDRKRQEQELQSIGDSVTKALADRIAGLPQKKVESDLRTGQLGEAVTKLILELRGYAVAELQNKSSHGVDLVGIKVKGDLIVYVEVKSSATDHSGSLSPAQKNTPEFVRSRLERVVAHEGFYKNVSDKVVELAKMLISEIDSGRPIGGVRVSVKWLSNGRPVVKFSHWKPVAPQAKASVKKK